MQPRYFTSTNAAVFDRLVKPDHGDLSPEAAREILSLQFDDGDVQRMNQLSLKAQEGTLTPDEQAEIESYRRDTSWASSGRRHGFPCSVLAWTSPMDTTLEHVVCDGPSIAASTASFHNPSRRFPTRSTT